MSEVMSVECPSPHVYNPHLKKVLKSYQTSAMTSLSGPNSCMAPASWGKLCNADVPVVMEPDMKKCLNSTTTASVHHHHHHQHQHQPQHHHQTNTNQPSQNHHHHAAAASTTISPPAAAAASSTPVSAKKSAATETAAGSNCANSGVSSGSSPTKLCRTTPNSVEYDPFLAPPPFPIQQVPILTAPDQGRSERSETQLEGETISCFIVGGEKRLCLPQILNSVLREFSLQQINLVCDELQIFCSRCNHEQLEVLKATGVLPFTAPSCGLITKTDAERLCNALLYSTPQVRAPRHATAPGKPGSEAFPGSKPGEEIETAVNDKQRTTSSDISSVQFKVYHECFGKCKGIYVSDMYSSPNALCIECTECHGLFPPQKFVCHAHKALENRTCHWGFDSANWRAYILLANDQPNTDKLQLQLDDMKARYDYGNNKRKQYEQEEKDLSKKVKYAEDSSFGGLPYNLYDPMLAAAYWYPPTTAWSRVSAFRPWSPMVGKDGKPCLSSHHSSFMRESVPQSLPSFLSHGPPVLLNPERVVPISETERFERHYQPNVALAPASAQLQANQKTTAVPSGSRYSSPVKSASHLDDATSHKALLSNPEMDVSTDTDETLSDSTIGAESTDYVPDKDMAGLTKSADLESAPETPVNPETELEPIQKLLDERGIGTDILEQVMKEVDKLRDKYKEELAIALQAKKSLQQELEFHKVSSKEKLREASETKRILRKEIKQAQLEHGQQMKEALEAQQQLRRELEATRIRRGDKIHEVAARANLAAENEQLRARLEAVEAELSQARKSNQEVGSAKPFTSCTESPSPPVIKQEVVDDESSHSDKLAGE